MSIQDRSLLIKINWLYYSIKEQYKFINSKLNKYSLDSDLLSILENEIKYYKISLTLFKKSFFEFQYSFQHGFTNEKIYLIKEVYLRRSLINLKQALDYLVHNNVSGFTICYKELYDLFNSLISSLKELGISLDRV
jgi:hypothetical protein